MALKKIYIYIYILICLEFSIIMTTEIIYISTVRKSRHNNRKAMYSLKVFYFYTKFST